MITMSAPSAAMRAASGERCADGGSGQLWVGAATMGGAGAGVSSMIFVGADEAAGRG